MPAKSNRNDLFTSCAGLSVWLFRYILCVFWKICWLMSAGEFFCLFVSFLFFFFFVFSNIIFVEIFITPHAQLKTETTNEPNTCRIMDKIWGLVRGVELETRRPVLIGFMEMWWGEWGRSRYKSCARVRAQRFGEDCSSWPGRAHRR